MTGPAGRVLPVPRAVLLDLDGTLVDTVGMRVAAWVEAFAAEGIEVTPDELGPWMGADGRWLAGEVAAAHGHALDAIALDRLDRVSGALFGERAHDPRPLAGARELLRVLSDLGIPWAVATSSRPDQAYASLRALDVGAPLLVDASHVAHAKPEPDLLLAGATQLGVPPGQAWYVGDARWDMLAAVRAGMPAVGVTTGATDEATLRESGAVHVVARLPDLVPLLSEPPQAP